MTNVTGTIVDGEGLCLKAHRPPRHSAKQRKAQDKAVVLTTIWFAGSLTTLYQTYKLLSNVYVW